MSAEQLLRDAALFADHRHTQPYAPVDGLAQLEEYCDWFDKYPVPYKMLKGHVFGLIGMCGWGLCLPTRCSRGCDCVLQ